MQPIIKTIKILGQNVWSKQLLLPPQKIKNTDSLSDKHCFISKISVIYL